MGLQKYTKIKKPARVYEKIYTNFYDYEYLSKIQDLVPS